jgi:hypothetical protein
MDNTYHSASILPRIQHKNYQCRFTWFFVLRLHSHEKIWPYSCMKLIFRKGIWLNFYIKGAPPPFKSQKRFFFQFSNFHFHRCSEVCSTLAVKSKTILAHWVSKKPMEWVYLGRNSFKLRIIYYMRINWHRASNCRIPIIT